jgi:hypothetical protein
MKNKLNNDSRSNNKLRLTFIKLFIWPRLMLYQREDVITNRRRLSRAVHRRRGEMGLDSSTTNRGVRDLLGPEGAKQNVELRRRNKRAETTLNKQANHQYEKFCLEASCTK